MTEANLLILKCSCCGAPLTRNENRPTEADCEYCGTPFRLKDGEWRANQREAPGACFHTISW